MSSASHSFEEMVLDCQSVLRPRTFVEGTVKHASQLRKFLGLGQYAEAILVVCGRFSFGGAGKIVLMSPRWQQQPKRV